MKRIVLNIKNKKNITYAACEAARVLHTGGVIVYPTDTAYGLGANVFNRAAVRRVFRIKGRLRIKPLPIAVAGVAMARRIAAISKSAERFLARVWPGTVTVVLPRRRKLSPTVSSGNSVGVRQPNHAFTKALFKHINFPITATSANIAGKTPVYDIKSFVQQFAKQKFKPDLIIDTGRLPLRKPSTVIDVTKKKPVILRKGAVPAKKLFRLLKNTSKHS